MSRLLPHRFAALLLSLTFSVPAFAQPPALTVLEVEAPRKMPADSPELQQLDGILRKRLRALGYDELMLNRQGERQYLVDTTGMREPDFVRRYLTTPGHLRLMKAVEVFDGNIPDIEKPVAPWRQICRLDQHLAQVTATRSGYDKVTTIHWTPEGRKFLFRSLKGLSHENMALFCDDICIITLGRLSFGGARTWQGVAEDWSRASSLITPAESVTALGIREAVEHQAWADYVVRREQALLHPGQLPYMVRIVPGVPG